MPRPGPVGLRLLRVGVSAAVATYILRDLDLGDLGRALGRVRLDALGVAVGAYLAGQVLSAYKWSLLGRSVGLGHPVQDYIRFYLIGMFFNCFGPSTVGGDLARALYLGGSRRPGLALNSVLFDRLSGLVVLIALGAAALLAFPSHGLPWPLVAGTVGAGATLAVGWWMCPPLARLLPTGSRLRHQVEVELAPFWRDRGLLLAVAAVSLVFHLSQVGVVWVLARAVGRAVPFSYCLVLHPIVSVMAALPVSVGGLGVREGGYLYFLTRIGVDDSIAVTMGVLWFSVTLLAGMVGGLLFLLTGAARRGLPGRASGAADVAGPRNRSAGGGERRSLG